MKQQNSPWPPVVGDEVRIKENGFQGAVVKTKGVHEARFRLSVSSKTPDGGSLPRTEARAARIASRWYGLDELEPLS